ALEIVDERGRDTGLVFGLDGPVDWGRFLARYNVFGLSNTAYRAEVLRRLPPAPVGGPAIDWSLATRAWSAGRSLYFDPVPRWAYRQYEANVARVLAPFSAGHVASATEVVRAHYRSLLDGGTALAPQLKARLDEARDGVEAFQREVVERPARLSEYA